MNDPETHPRRSREGMLESVRLDVSYDNVEHTLEDMVEILLEGTQCYWRVVNEVGPAGGWPEVVVIGSRVELDAVQARYDGEMMMEYCIWARNFDEMEIHQTTVVYDTEPEARSLVRHLMTPPTTVAEAEYRWREVGPWNRSTSISLSTS